jgi:hypothetical protein
MPYCMHNMFVFDWDTYCYYHNKIFDAFVASLTILYLAIYEKYWDD